MTKEEFNSNIEWLRSRLNDVVDEYIQTNQKYKVGDVLRISFHKYYHDYVYFCKIFAVTNVPYCDFVTHTYWPSSTISYFARFCWKEDGEEFTIGEHCPLGDKGNYCGHIGIDMNTLVIEVIDESEVGDFTRIETEYE